MVKFTALILLLATTAQAAAPIIWQDAFFGKYLTRSGFKLYDDKQYLSLTVDPTAGAGIAAPIGSLGQRSNAGVGESWFKVGAANTAWTNILFGNTGWQLLGNAGTTVGTNFLGTTDAVGLSLKTNSTEAIRIDSSQKIGLNQASPDSVLHAKHSPMV